MISPKVAAILRMLDSDQGDAVAALGKVKLLLRRENLTFGDLSRVLEKVGKESSTEDADIDQMIRRYREEAAREAAMKEACRREEARKQQAEAEAYWAARSKEEDRKNAPLRAEVIARYGSVRAAKAWTPEELALRDAVRPWSTFQQPPLDIRFIKSIDGATSATSHRDIPARILEALSAALPLPVTIPEAKAEMDRWARRDLDLQLVYRSVGNTQLDLPAEIRERIVRRLFEEELRASSIADVLMRQQYLVDQACTTLEMDIAVLADLEALAAAQDVQFRQLPSPPNDNAEGVQFEHSVEHRTATHRREAVQAMLADPATATLPDRELARRTGVSPSTIGNIRRRVARNRQGDLFGEAA